MGAWATGSWAPAADAHLEAVLVSDLERAAESTAIALLIGHMAGYWALEHHLARMPLHQVGRRFTWQEGWTYTTSAPIER